jgi:hypothetical protein
MRLAVCWAAHTRTDDPHAVVPRALERVLTLIEATACGLAVVVNNAWDPELMLEPARQRERWLGATYQVADALASFGADVMLEPSSRSSDSTASGTATSSI